MNLAGEKLAQTRGGGSSKVQLLMEVGGGC